MEGGDIDDWLGCEDLIINTDEQLSYTVSKIKEGYDLLVQHQGLQKEFIISHKFLPEGGALVTYSDGTQIRV